MEAPRLQLCSLKYLLNTSQHLEMSDKHLCLLRGMKSSTSTALLWQSHSLDCHQLSLPWNRGGFNNLQGTDTAFLYFTQTFKALPKIVVSMKRGNKSIGLNSLRGEWDQEAEAGLVTTLPCFISLPELQNSRLGPKWDPINILMLRSHYRLSIPGSQVKLSFMSQFSRQSWTNCFSNSQSQWMRFLPPQKSFPTESLPPAFLLISCNCFTRFGIISIQSLPHCVMPHDVWGLECFFSNHIRKKVFLWLFRQCY